MCTDGYSSHLAEGLLRLGFYKKVWVFFLAFWEENNNFLAYYKTRSFLPSVDFQYKANSGTFIYTYNCTKNEKVNKKTGEETKQKLENVAFIKMSENNN